jgi:hypothetical protein
MDSNETRRGPKAARALRAAAVAGAIGSALCAACCGGVSANVVQLEATQIKKNAEAAQALHARCLDAGPDADPVVADTFCTAEMRALTDIQQNADTLLQQAGADGGSGG